MLHYERNLPLIYSMHSLETTCNPGYLFIYNFKGAQVAFTSGVTINCPICVGGKVKSDQL